MKGVLYLCLLSVGISVISGCTFPSDLTGTWIHSLHGTAEMTSTTMQLSQYTDGSITLTCTSYSDPKYLLKSGQFSNAGGNLVYLSTCFELTKLRDNLYKIVYRALENAKAYNYRYVETGSNPSPTVGVECADSSGDPDIEYYLLMKSGTTVSVDAPTNLQGKLSYTFDTTHCSGNNGLLDTCADKTLIDIDYTKCTTKVGYSSDGHLRIIYYTSSSSTYTLWTHNQDASVDNSVTYAFTCFMISTTGTTVITMSGTQNPQFCDATQTTTTTATNGKKITGTLASAELLNAEGHILHVLFCYILFIILKYST